MALAPTDASPPADPPAEPPEVSAAVEHAAAAARAAAEDRNDARVLPFVLLHRARMHAMDLRRKLALFSDEDGRISLSRGEVRTHDAWRLDLLTQVAVEMVMESPKLESRLRVDPEFRRLAHDALYWLSRRWADAKEMNLGDDSEADFGRDLEKRMGAHEWEDFFRSPPGAEPALRVADRRFLFEQVRTLADLLSSPSRFGERFKGWRGHGAAEENGKLKEIISQTLRLEQGGLALLAPTGQPFRYLWRYDVSGNPLDGSHDAEAHASQDWQSSSGYILRFDHHLARLTRGGKVDFSTLSSQLHVIGVSPAYPAVRQAIERLEAQEEQPGDPDAWSRDARVVADFAELLRRSASTITDALLCGSAVAALAQARGGARRLLGLRTVSEGYRFAELPADEVDRRLRELKAQLRERALLPADDPRLPVPKDDKTAVAWGAEMEKLLATVEAAAADAASLREEAWESARARVAAYAASGHRIPPQAAELMVAAAEEPPSNLVHFDLAAMTLAQWSSLLHAGLCVYRWRPWLALSALRPLGLRPRSLRELVEWMSEQKLVEDAAVDLAAADGAPPGGVAPTAPLVVIIRRASGSLVERWPVDPRAPAIALTEEQADAILRLTRARLRELPPLQPPLGVVAFEMPPDSRDGDERLLKSFRRRVPETLFAGMRVKYVYAASTSPMKPEPVIAPRGVAELAPEPPTASL